MRQAETVIGGAPARGGQTGSVEAALRHARSLLQDHPALAARQAASILQALPGHPEALLIQGAAYRRLGEFGPATDVLQPLAAAQPGSADAQAEWALTQAELGDGAGAVASLRRAAVLKPSMPQIWRMLGDMLFASGDLAAAEAAYARHLQAAAEEPALRQAGCALVDGDLQTAEALLSHHLEHCRTDIAAIRMLAEAKTRAGRNAEAQALLEWCLQRHPGFTLARHNLALVLHRQDKPADAIHHLEHLLRQDHAPNLLSLYAACLAMICDYDAAIRIYEPLLAAFPDQPRIWLSYGHALKTIGRRPDAARAYRQAAAQEPGLGEAYWSLANLKNEAFGAAELRTIQVQLTRPGLSAEDRFHLHYALGHILERQADFAASWHHYDEGARLRRAQVTYDAGRTTAQLARTRALMTEQFFAERAGSGCDHEAPIFIVGLPRSGSTLLEQVLSSHSRVEGTMELAEMASIAGDLGRNREAAYPEVLADLAAADFNRLGARYLDRTRRYRKTGKPVFVDKMPNNFVHTGLIHLILPRARIIDARRHPMATCFSAFKQHFAKGQHYTYDLEELGRYYQDYLLLMRHFDQVLPGRVHRVVYEDVVGNTAGEVRRLLAHCGLDFEESCLAFYDNPRAVRTASSEQVRRPIFREGLHQWRNYEPWLAPLRAMLAADDAPPEP